MKILSMISGALILAGLLLSCGKSESGREPVDDATRKPEVKTLVAEKTKPVEEGGVEAAPPAVSMEEARNRQILAQLSAALDKAQDSYERGDVLARIKELGPVAKPLWTKLAPALEDPEPITRGIALETVAVVDPLSARPFLERGLADPDPEVRQKAATAWRLAGIKDLAPLLKLAGDEIDAGVQMAAMLAVEELGEDFLTSQVGDLLDALDANAAKPAVRFLGAHKAAAQGEKILELLTWHDMELRAQVARTLAEIGYKAKPALEALVTALRDDELPVRTAANDALKSLTENDLGFEPDWDLADQEDTLKAWAAWVEKNG